MQRQRLKHGLERVKAVRPGGAYTEVRLILAWARIRMRDRESRPAPSVRQGPRLPQFLQGQRLRIAGITTSNARASMGTLVSSGKPGASAPRRRAAAGRVLPDR